MAKKIVTKEELPWMMACGWRITDNTADDKYKITKSFVDWYFHSGIYWLTLFGHGMSVKDSTRHPPIPGERKSCHLGKWTIKLW